MCGIGTEQPLPVGRHRWADQHQVVVVVSAMGDTTDELIDLANEVSPLPPARELDMLLTAGEPGHRFALPNARIMVHQPSGGFQGQATDILIHAREIEALKKRLNEIYVKHTGRDYDTIVQALERDNFMTADAAKEFGLIDEVLQKRPEPAAA